MDKSSLNPIYGTWHIPFWQMSWFYITIYVFSAAVVSLVVWLIIKKIWTKKRKAKPSWEVAMDEIDSIEKLLAAKEILGKTFYFRLTWVFKRYLSARYGFDVYGKTDGELLLFLEGAGLAPNRVEDLRVIFEGSSVIKFAKERAIKERMLKDLSLSREFIKKTMPSEIP